MHLRSNSQSYQQLSRTVSSIYKECKEIFNLSTRAVNKLLANFWKSLKRQ